MKSSLWMASALVGVLALGGVVRAEEGGEEKMAGKVVVKEDQADKAEKKAEKKIKNVGFLPYRELASLTDEQKAQINDIHQKYLAERKKLEEAEKAEISALLTDEQKAEIRQMEEKKSSERKNKDGEKKEKKSEKNPE